MKRNRLSSIVSPKAAAIVAVATIFFISILLNRTDLAVLTLFVSAIVGILKIHNSRKQRQRGKAADEKV
jgi:hypothetical protein